MFSKAVRALREDYETGDNREEDRYELMRASLKFLIRNITE